MRRKLSESFIHRMAEAAFWESYAATCLSRMGFHVMHYPTDIQEDGFQKEGMYDSVDLSIMEDARYEGWCEEVPIEVKAWNNPPPRILCSKSSWVKKGYDKLVIHPVFIILNKSTGEMLWLPRNAEIGSYISWSDPGRDYSEDMVTFNPDDLKTMDRFKETYRGLIQKT